MRLNNVAAGLYPWAGKNQGNSLHGRDGRTWAPPRIRWPCWSRAVAVGLAALLAGCATPRLEFLGEPGLRDRTLADAGLQLTLWPNTWTGYPSDLARYYTPIQVHIQNDRPDPIQVRYEDFLALDDAQTQYRAVAPAEVVRALFGRGVRSGDAAGSPPLLAYHGPWWPYAPWPYRPWYPYGPYGWPWPYSYDYSPWPQGTGYDILARALREGPLLAGAHVEGFLYLQLATRQASSLSLSWTPKAPDGRPLATLQTHFRVIP